MEPSALAHRLVDARPDDYTAVLHTFVTEKEAPATTLAAALKQLYDESYTADVMRAVTASAILDTLAALIEDTTVRALAAWTAGLVAMNDGRLPEAIERLDRAEQLFAATREDDRVAAVRTGKMRALAMQGRFDEAFTTGMAARTYCTATGDLLAAGKIEQNLGNLHFVRHNYVEAEQFYRLALTNFDRAGDQQQLAQIDNCLATTLTSQHRFAEAEALYASAIQRAEAADLDVTLAEIECNVGCLALYQGRYDRALEYLERSRRRYAQLGIAHEVAIADQELADAYLELNMAAEAAVIYERVTPLFATLGMPIERARALAYHGRACILLDRYEQAHQLLEEARSLYAEAAMPVGEAITQLTGAQLHIQDGDLSTAATILTNVEPIFATAHAEGWRLQTSWLRGVVARRQGALAEAQQLLGETMHAAERVLASQLVQRCAGELGLVALASGDVAAAKTHFRHAIELIESLRAPLPAEEFRMGFIGDKLTPYIEMVRLCLADGSPARLIEAFGYAERSRARALVDMLSAGDQLLQPSDAYEAELFERMHRLRSELNWFYSQLNRPDSPATERGGHEVEEIQDAARRHEETILTILRQIQQRNAGAAAAESTLDLPALQRDLGADTALVEFFSIDANLLAFVVTNIGVATVELACNEAEIQVALQQFHFQLGALRHGVGHLQRHLSTLIQRIQRPLADLYDLLLAPMLSSVGSRRLVIAPHRMLHYVPFHALFDGERYVIETREVSVTPSATLLHHTLMRHRLAGPGGAPRHALLVGLPDEYAPRVAEEIATIAPLFEQSTTLMGEEATRRQLQHHAPEADLLHIACHGRFRSDNPYFSALHLADGWMIVRDAYELRLDCSLVTLSACETGLSALAPGEDLVGLARGFLLAGAPSLLVSLWMVDDGATAELMVSFYHNLLAGQRPAAALRNAQRELLAIHPHPFFWAPFTLIGRW